MRYIIIFLRLCQANPFIVFRDNELDIDELVFGEIPKFDDLFLPPENVEFLEDNKKHTKIDDDVEEDDSLNELPLMLTDFEPVKYDRATFEITEFNDLSKSVANLTRRYYGSWQGYTDPNDHSKDLEHQKRNKLDNITLQFLIHARYHIKKAIVQKHAFRLDRRYKMGYLFNRLRRLRYEQLKIVSMMEEQMKLDSWRELNAVMRFYEKVVRFDIDVKDTILLIKAIDKEDAKIKDAAFFTTKKPGGGLL